ncbi:stage II sporulation protein M [Candidatus Pacearchaeota archaeon]|nr:stage II sporulation protein M [Candidatus Pacearchaeota archaeon]
MLETLINPMQASKSPWKMFFIGLVYASLAILLVHWIFSGDPALAKFSGMIVVTFSVMFVLPFMYYLIKQEENDDEYAEGFFSVWSAHSDAIFAFMWLFLGFVIAFSFWFIILEDNNLFNAQIETYCSINHQGDIGNCISQYQFKDSGVTGEVTGRTSYLLSILENNAYVMIITLIFSLIFGAGVIFILAWNASVIAAAIAIFTKYSINDIPLGLLRYMIHGFPEIAAYFITALAGGIFGVGIIRNGFKGKKLIKIIENTLILLFIAIVILVAAAFVEVYITPSLF